MENLDFVQTGYNWLNQFGRAVLVQCNEDLRFKDLNIEENNT